MWFRIEFFFCFFMLVFYWKAIFKIFNSLVFFKKRSRSTTIKRFWRFESPKSTNDFNNYRQRSRQLRTVISTIYCQHQPWELITGLLKPNKNRGSKPALQPAAETVWFGIQSNQLLAGAGVLTDLEAYAEVFGPISGRLRDWETAVLHALSV